MKVVAICIALVLAGCAGNPQPPTWQIAAPAARLMTPAKPLPDVRENDDLYEHAAVCRAEYGTETGKLTSLQQYVRVLRKKR